MFSAVILAIAMAVTAPAALAAVEWDVTRVYTGPTVAQPGEPAGVQVLYGNVGDTTSTGWPTITVELPAGVTFAGTDTGNGWSCSGSSTVSCSNPLAGLFGFNVAPESYHPQGFFSMMVDVDSGAAHGEYEVPVTVSGGGAPAPSESQGVLKIGDEQPGFGIHEGSFEALALDETGAPYTQAGGHPHSATTAFRFNTKFNEPGPGAGYGEWTEMIEPVGNLRNVVTELPAGFVGNPTTGTTCPDLATLRDDACPPESQVGVALLDQRGSAFRARMTAVYNMEPAGDEPARFVFETPASQSEVSLIPMLRSDGDWGLSIRALNANEGNPLYGVRVTLWGVPADPSHDAQRCAKPSEVTRSCVGHDEVNGGTGDPQHESHSYDGVPEPFLANPTECTGQPETTRMHISTWADWQSPARFEPDGDADLSDPNWQSVVAEAPPLTGCGSLTFEAGFEATPTASQAGGPTGLDVEIKTPQNDDPGGLATAHLRDTEVVLPEGMVVNPSSADGLAGCSSAQIGMRSKDPVRFSRLEPSCPSASKIGSVAVDTPLLEDPLEGEVYVAAQGDNPFDSLLAIYLVMRGPGILGKLAGHVEADPDTGRLTTTVVDNPQVPFEALKLRLKGGPRAPLTVPGTCGSNRAVAGMTSWAGHSVEVEDVFEVACTGDEGGFDPGFAAGTTNPAAGAHSPFVARFTREDGEKEIKRLDVALPEGLTGKLAGIPYCSEEALASFGSDGITEPGTAQDEIDDPTCPEASRVGRVTVGAGAGPAPFYLQTGRAYLAGPYKGAPLSLAIVTPAKAGPFDLGNVMVRSALRVNQRTAQITVKSDPLPTILEGIPLKIRDLRVIMDREDFTLNPTNCQETKVWALAMGASGTHANLENRFQVADCAALGFAPRFGMRIMNRGRKSTVRSFNPRMRFALAPKAGEANIDRAAVTLPPSIILDQNNLDTICTRAQFAIRDCPQGSVVGYARAWSPLLDRPVQGRVYLGSSTNQLPDLIADLQGQVPIVLQGRIDSVKGRIRNTFDVVPDVPVTRFQLDMRGGKQRGILVNSTDQCRNTKRAVANFRGQNGVRSLTRPRLGLRFKGCKQVRKKAARKQAARSQARRASRS